MKRIVPVSQVEEATGFPYEWSSPKYSEELLRSFLYSPDDPTLCDDDHCLVLDFDGFVEWFPEWNAMYRDEADEDWYKDDEGMQYLIYHIGRTVTPLKGVTEG